MSKAGTCSLMFIFVFVSPNASAICQWVESVKVCYMFCDEAGAAVYGVREPYEPGGVYGDHSVGVFCFHVYCEAVYYFLDNRRVDVVYSPCHPDVRVS